MEVDQDERGKRIQRPLENVGKYDAITRITDWCLPSVLEQNPLAWMIEVNGLPENVRMMPKEVQEEAYRLGLIPYVPQNALKLVERCYRLFCVSHLLV